MYLAHPDTSGPSSTPAHSREPSWSSNTRDSVVDNLLLSFDRMPGQDLLPHAGSYAQYDDGADDDDDDDDDEFGDYGATPPRLAGRTAQHSRGHSHAYSSSLSTTGPSADDSSSYTRNHSSRSRRSNSSSNFMGSPSSVPRPREGNPKLLARSSSETQRTIRMGLHSRGSAAKGSKSSAASSFDYGYGQILSTSSIGPSLVPHHLGDHGFAQSAPDVATSSSVLSRGRPVPSLFSAYEAPCPEPNIPSGPMKNLDSLTPSSLPQSSPASRPRSRTDQQLSSDNGGSSSSSMSPDIPQTIRDQASDFVRATTMRSGVSVPKMDQAVSTPQSTMSAKQAAAQDSAASRPGFLRRMFGSSSRAGSTSADMQKPLSRESSTVQDALEPNRKPSVPNAPHITSQIRGNMTEVSAQPAMPNVVNKKPSFFRRRKKSIAEDTRPPLIPPSYQDPAAPRQADQQAPPSPGASSLRDVLGQYLVNVDEPTPSGQIPLSRFVPAESPGDADSLDMFHSGYTPPPDATLRRNAPLDHRTSVALKPHDPASRPDLIAPKPRTPPDADKLQVLAAKNENQKPEPRQNGSFMAHPGNVEDRSAAPSTNSALANDSVLVDDGLYAPISPLSTVPPEGGLFNAPSASQPEWTPGPSIRAVTSKFGRKESDTVMTRPQTDSQVTRSSRAWLDQADGEFSIPFKDSTSSAFSPSTSAVDAYERKESVPVVQLDGNEVRPSVDIARQLEAAMSNDPRPEDMERAKKIFDGNEDNVSKLQAASWLGERSQVSARTLKAYMSLFDWSGQNVLSAMRSLCERLTLRAESQQVDRILEAFATRWAECNPKNGFKGPGVIHNICYALMLLNTDLHVADIQHKMTRSEFIKNTMPAINDAAEKTVKPSRRVSRPVMPWQDSTASLPGSPTFPPAPQEAEERASGEYKRSKRLSLRPQMGRNETDPGPSGDGDFGASNALTNVGYDGTERGWISEMEIVLKSFYNSIVSEALPLHRATEADAPTLTSNLSVTASVLRRTGSVISKAPSEGYSYRGRKVSDTQTLTQRWHSKNRTRPKVYPASTVASSRTSFDDNSIVSPAGSSMWSRISNGRTQPTMSVESFALSHDFKQSVGFTNALSQAIIREEGEKDNDSFHRMGSLLEDESLGLAGAPWAKEGIVKHKHHLEGPEKKARERSWNECFAVVEKGYLHLFAFNRPTTKINAGTMRARRNTAAAKAPSFTPSVVGGGNWTDNAEELGQFLLRQTIATSLPKPGYSKTRPFVWALSLPSGAVHLFQVGTAEIAEEFATSANYWSARLSKEPLVGGIDNIEYGWSEAVVNPALITNSSHSPPPSRNGSGAGSSPTHHSTSNSLSTITGIQTRQSTQSSLRGSLDQQFGSKPRLPGDRAVIQDWRPPAASMLPSQLLEIDQLRSLKAYVASVEAELQKHNELRNALPLSYVGRGSNFNRVMQNWERKSSYLLREVVKFRTYIEALDKAEAAKKRIYEERRIRDEENAAIREGKTIVSSL